MMDAWVNYTHSRLDERMSMAEYAKNYWKTAKEEYLLELFDHKLIHSTFVDVEVSKETLIGMIENDPEFLRLMQHLRSNLWFLNSEIHENSTKKLVDFTPDVIEQFQKENILSTWNIIDNLDVETIVNKKSNCDKLTFHIPTEKKKVYFRPEQSPLQIIKKYAAYINKSDIIDDNKVIIDIMDYVNKIENFVSEKMNQSHLTGELCISIHPMDYMTMSDNDCGWSSCMSWAEEGEYHAGTLEMMTSPCVVVAYLKSEKPWQIIPGEPYYWNSKKWRELFIVDRRFIAGIKGYPYQSEQLEKLVFEKLVKMARAHNFGNFENSFKIEKTEVKAFIPVGEEGIKLKTVVMYNDAQKNDISYVLPKDPQDCYFDSFEYYYGLGAHCVVCGELRWWSKDVDGLEGELVCLEHSDLEYCDFCRDLFYPEALYEGPDGRMYCASCYYLRFDEDPPID